MSALTPSRTRAAPSPVQILALVVGIVFLIVGFAGFIPGLTTNYESLGVAGHHSEALLLGVFQVSILHNIIHLIFGLAGIFMFRSPEGGRNFLLIGGIIYLVLFVYGLIIDLDSAVNFVPLNSADNWLHLGLGVAMMALSFLPGRPSASEEAYQHREDTPMTYTT